MQDLMGSSLDIYKKRNNSRLNHNQEGSIPFEPIWLQQSVSFMYM